MAQTVKSTSSATSKVLQALGVLGSVQVVTVLCSVIRTKLVALLDRPGGCRADYTFIIRRSTSFQIILRSPICVKARHAIYIYRKPTRQKSHRRDPENSLVLGFCRHVAHPCRLAIY